MIKKYFILLTILFFSFLHSSSQVLIANGSKCNFKYTDYIYSVCQDLQIHNKYIIIRDTHLSVQAYSCKINDSIYVVFVNKYNCTDIAISLAHELIHISDDIGGVYEISTPTFNPLSDSYTSSEARLIERSTRRRSRKIKYTYKHLIHQY